jgi:hypothetical protein
MTEEACMTKQRLTPDEYYAALAEPYKSIALAARSLLLGIEAVDVIEEEIKYGIPFYSREGMVCYMNVNKSGVTIGFLSGSQMSDTFGLFTGKSLKMVRHLALPSIDFIREKQDEISNYFIEALIINDSKSRK